MPVALVFAMMVAGTLFGPAERALLPSIVEPEELVPATAVERTATSSAQLSGAALGGLVLGLFGPVLLFALNGLTFVVSAASLALMRTARYVAPPGGAGGLRSLWSDVVEGQRVVWRSLWLRRVVIVSILVNFALAPIDYLGAAWVRQALHAEAVVYGLFATADLAGMMVGSAAAAPVARRAPVAVTVPLALAGGGLCLVLVSRVLAVVPDLAGLFGLGVSLGLMNETQWPAVQRAVEDRLRGRVFGTLTALTRAAVPLSAILVALVAGVVPLPAVYLATGVLMAVCSLLMAGAAPAVVAAAGGEPIAG